MRVKIYFKNEKGKATERTRKTFEKASKKGATKAEATVTPRLR
jgi:hypothetical protein